MAGLRRLLEGDSGLIGKLIVAWLLLAALLVVLAIDGGSILLARYRTANLAQDVAFAAAETYAETGDLQAAEVAARGEVDRASIQVRLQRVEANGREITVVLVGRAGTLVIGRLPFTGDLAKVTVTDTATPSSA